VNAARVGPVAASRDLAQHATYHDPHSGDLRPTPDSNRRSRRFPRVGSREGQHLRVGRPNLQKRSHPGCCRITRRTEQTAMRCAARPRQERSS